jgi:hypothetical protein
MPSPFPRSLEQGPVEGWPSIAKIIAKEWQDDGYLRAGEIVEIYPMKIVADSRGPD